MITAEDILRRAAAEIGYLEKRTNAELDEKTANAGRGNFTKYARDLDAVPELLNGPKNGYDWCAVFVLWLFLQSAGAAETMRVLRLPERSAAASCTYLAGRFRAAGKLDSTPRPGALAFFTANGGRSFYHIGVVEKTENGTVQTIEGNTAGGSGIVANGGGVFRKTYRSSNPNIRYGHPAYDAVPAEITAVQTEVWLNRDARGRILDLAVRTDRGALWYQVHTLNGRWLPRVTGFDPADFRNGYAGNHVPIDAVRIYYETPAGEPYKQARYAVRTEKDPARWLPDQVDDSTAGGMDGYAGNPGEAITDFRFRVDDH